MTPQQELAELEELDRLERAAANSSGGSVLDAAKSGATDVTRGVGKSVAAMPGALPPVNMLRKLIPQFFMPLNTPMADRAQAFNMPDPMAVQGARKIEEILPTPQGDSQARQYGRAGLEGVGGMLALGPQNLISGGIKEKLASVLAGLGGGMGAKAGGEYGKSINPALEEAGSFLGGAVGGGIPAFALGPSLSSGQKRLSEATRELPPQTWEEAAKNVDSFSRVGSTTATLADAFPRNSSLMGVAEDVRGSKGGEGLVARTTGRDKDIQRIAEVALNKAHPQEVGVNDVTGRAVGSANKALENLKDLRGEAIGNRFAGVSIRPDKVKELETTLRNVGNGQEVPEAARAYHTVADRLLAKDGSVLTKLQDLSLQIKSLKSDMKNPNSPLGGSGEIMKNHLRQAVADAEQGLGEIAPAFEPAMKDFGAYTQQVIEPARKGPIGRLSDRNPLTAGAEPVSKLNSLLNGNSPKEVQRTAQTLADSELTKGSPTSAGEIARALMQAKLEKGPTDPGKAIRGAEGSAQEGRLAALLAAGGKNPVEVLEPLQVTDKLQNFMGNPGHRGQEMPSMLSAAAQPSWYAKMLANVFTGKGTTREIAEVLKDPANLPKLQELAQFDPNVRRMLIANSMTAPQISQGDR